jgi:hypothetical protein
VTTLLAGFAAALPLLCGGLALRAAGLRWRTEPLAFAAWAYLLGSLLVAVWLQVVLLAGLGTSRLVHLLLAPLLLGLWLRRPPADWRPAPGLGSRPGRAYAGFVVVVVAMLLVFVLAGLDRPCIEGDEGNFWSLKAKSLLVDWGPGFAAAQVYNLHPDYPQLNPLLQTWMYVWTGVPDFDQFRARWPVQFANVALFVALAAALRARLSARWAAPLAAVVALEPEFLQLCRIAYADGMVALGLVVALDAGLRWRSGGERRWLWLAMFGLAYAAWAKNETMLYLVALGLATMLVRLVHGSRRDLPGDASWRGRALCAWWPVLVVVVGNGLWNRAFGLQSDLLGANPTGKSMFALMAEQWPERVPALLAEFGALLVDVGHAHPLFLALVLAPLLAWRSLHARGLLVPTLALLGSLVGLHVVYVGSFLPLRFHLDTSYTRVLFQVLPVTVLLLGTYVSPVARRLGTEDTAGQT